MSRYEQKVVISQKKSSHIRLLDRTEPAVRAGDDKAAAGLAVDLGGGPTLHGCSPASRSRSELNAPSRLTTSPGVDEHYRQLTDRLCRRYAAPGPHERGFRVRSAAVSVCG